MLAWFNGGLFEKSLGLLFAFVAFVFSLCLLFFRSFYVSFFGRHLCRGLSFLWPSWCLKRKAISKPIFFFVCLSCSFLFSLLTLAESNTELQVPRESKLDEKKGTRHRFSNETHKNLSTSTQSTQEDHQTRTERLKSLYQKALVHYQEQEFHSSKELFYRALEEQEDNPAILYNLGLVEFKTQNPYLALAFWRKTLFLSPLHPWVRQALKTYHEQKEAHLDKKFWPLFREKVLSYFSLHFILGVSLILMTLSGFLFIRHQKWSYEKKNDSVSSSPFVPSWLRSFIFFLFFFSLGLSGFKVLEAIQPRATVIIDSSPLRIGPKEEDNILLNVEGGSEVILKQKKQKWFRVISDSGASGWVLSSSLFQTSGRSL